MVNWIMKLLYFPKFKPILLHFEKNFSHQDGYKVPSKKIIG